MFTSKTWISSAQPVLKPSVPTDRFLNVLLVCLLIIQLVYGAFVRHQDSAGLLFHISFAALIFLNAIGSGVRAWGLYPEQPVLNRLGLILMGLVVLQLTLGVGALAAIGYANMQQRLTVLDVTVTTAHQATGALLLVVSVLLMLWSFRLLQKPVAQQNPADALPSAQNASLHS